MASYSQKDQHLILGSLIPSRIDVDKMEICMTPAHLLAQAGGTLAMTRLSSHAPTSKTTREGDRGHEFSDWLLLADLGFQIWVDPDYKEGFFKELKKLRTIQAAQYDFASSYGNALMATTKFVKCLQRAGCDTLRYKVYGHKNPLMMPYYIGEPAEAGHPQAHLNEWDIGITYKSSHIFLFKPALGQSKYMKVYSMMTPAGRGYGSVQRNIVYNDTTYKVKIYPRIVHVIKSFNSRLQGETITKIAGIRRRIKASVQMIQHLHEIPESELGGFRIEVSVQAPTLAIAKQWVENTPLLDINYWYCPETEDHKLGIFVTHKKPVLDNANWMIQRAETLNVIRGDDHRTPNDVQMQVAIDILSSLGWNAGKGQPTKSSSMSAWWRGTDTQKNRPIKKTTNAFDTRVGNVLYLLNQRYRGTDGIHKLVAEVRKHHKSRRIPCQENSAHSYNICEAGYRRAPFRMRCNNGYCRHNMSAGETWRWLATLVTVGKVRPSGLSLLTETDINKLNIKVIPVF